MRIVASTDERWMRPGVGSTDIASVCGCAADSDANPLLTWAKIVSKAEIQSLKKASKAMRKQHLEQGSPEWLDWRKMGVGGSEVGAVMGKGAYYPRAENSAEGLWAKKLPKDDPRSKPEQASNSFMAHGTKFEPEARKLYETLYGWSVEPLCILHDDHDFVRCSLDGWRADGDLSIEIKCPQAKNFQKYLEISHISDPMERQRAFSEGFLYTRYQILYQLLITGAKACHFVAYSPEHSSPEDRLVVFSLYPEPAEQRRLLERVVEFWGFVERREPVPKEWLLPVWKHPEEIVVPEEPPPTTDGG